MVIKLLIYNFINVIQQQQKWKRNLSSFLQKVTSEQVNQLCLKSQNKNIHKLFFLWNLQNNGKILMGILTSTFQRSIITIVNLILYYSDVDRWGFTFQIYAYQSRLMAWDRQLQQVLQNNQQNKQPVLVFTERSIESARELFFKLCYCDGKISQIEYEIYEEFYQWLMNHYQQYLIDCVIYVNTPPEVCLERLIKRGRQEESCVPLDYLKKLHQRHEDWLSEKSNRFKTIKIDATLNYVQDKKVKESVRQLLLLEIQKLKELLI